MDKILLANDWPASLKKASECLEKAGFEVVASVNGAEALAKLREAPDSYDLFCSDVFMPIMDGFELWAAVRNDPFLQNLPIVILDILPNEAESYEIARKDRYRMFDNLHAGVYKVPDAHSRNWGSNWEETLVEVVNKMLNISGATPKRGD